MKVLVDRMIQLAQERISNRRNPPKLDALQTRIQNGFNNDPALASNELLANLTKLITGFRPMLNKPVGRPFEIWMYKSNGKEAPYIGMSVAGDKVWGCGDLANAGIYYDVNCRIATPEEAEKFLETVDQWDDAAVCKWVNEKLGSGHMSSFLNALEL